MPPDNFSCLFCIPGVRRGNDFSTLDIPQSVFTRRSFQTITISKLSHLCCALRHWKWALGCFVRRLSPQGSNSKSKWGSYDHRQRDILQQCNLSLKRQSEGIVFHSCSSKILASRTYDKGHLLRHWGKKKSRAGLFVLDRVKKLTLAFWQLVCVYLYIRWEWCIKALCQRHCGLLI